MMQGSILPYVPTPIVPPKNHHNLIKEIAMIVATGLAIIAASYLAPAILSAASGLGFISTTTAEAAGAVLAEGKTATTTTAVAAAAKIAAGVSLALTDAAKQGLSIAFHQQNRFSGLEVVDSALSGSLGMGPSQEFAEGTTMTSKAVAMLKMGQAAVEAQLVEMGLCLRSHFDPNAVVTQMSAMAIAAAARKIPGEGVQANIIRNAARNTADAALGSALYHTSIDAESVAMQSFNDEMDGEISEKLEKSVRKDRYVKERENVRERMYVENNKKSRSDIANNSHLYSDKELKEKAAADIKEYLKKMKEPHKKTAYDELSSQTSGANHESYSEWDNLPPFSKMVLGGFAIAAFPPLAEGAASVGIASFMGPIAEINIIASGLDPALAQASRAVSFRAGVTVASAGLFARKSIGQIENVVNKIGVGLNKLGIFKATVHEADAQEIRIAVQKNSNISDLNLVNHRISLINSIEQDIRLLQPIATIKELLKTGYKLEPLGVTLNQKFVNFNELWELTKLHEGIEFAVTRETIGGRKFYRLYSGDQNQVVLPDIPGIRILAHTHPLGEQQALPSYSDIKTLNKIYDKELSANPMAQRVPSRVIWGGETHQITLFHPTMINVNRDELKKYQLKRLGI